MAVPNCIAVLVLGGIVAKETKHYVYDGHLEDVYPEEVPSMNDK